MKVTPDQVIENLRKIREAKKIKQNVMAERLGISSAAYSKLEKVGESNPNLKTISRICDALGVEMIEAFRHPDVREKSLAEKLELIEALPESERLTVENLLNMALGQNQSSQSISRKEELEELTKGSKYTGRQLDD